MTIVEFLEARLAEDEAIANAGAQSFSDTWTFDNGEEAARREEASKGGRFGANPRVDGITSGCRYNSESEMKHIARHDPARALAEVAAKRAILTQEETARSQFEHVKSSTTYPAIEVLIGQVAALATVIRHLASAYADHPDYQQEWALNP